MLRINKLQKSGLETVSNAVVGVAAGKATGYVAAQLWFLEHFADEMMNQIFVTMVKYMGEEADLASRIGSQHAPSWRPLAKSYVERKGTPAFWIYTGLGAPTLARLRKPTPFRANQRTLPKPQRVNNSLIKSLARRSGREAFGQVKVVSGIAVESADEEKIRDGLFAALNPRGGRDFAEFTIRFFIGGPPPTEMGAIESYLARRGTITPLMRRKLVGKRRYHRPLMLPFLKWWVGTIIPQSVTQQLRRNLNASRSRPLRSFRTQTVTRNRRTEL